MYKETCRGCTLFLIYFIPSENIINNRQLIDLKIYAEYRFTVIVLIFNQNIPTASQKIQNTIGYGSPYNLYVQNIWSVCNQYVRRNFFPCATFNDFKEVGVTKKRTQKCISQQHYLCAKIIPRIWVVQVYLIVGFQPHWDCSLKESD